VSRTVTVVDGTAFVGTATYLGSHDNTFVQLATNGNMAITYIPGTGINADASGSVADFEFVNILDGSGNELNTPVGEAIHVEYTIVSATVPGGTTGGITGGIGQYIDIDAALDGYNKGQLTTGVRNDGSGNALGFVGAHNFGVWQNATANIADSYQQTAAPVTFPAEFVIYITAAGIATVTINGEVLGPIDLEGISDPRIAEYRERLYKSCFACTEFGGEMVIENLLVSGISIPYVNLPLPDVNLPPAPSASITLDGAVDEPFIWGTAAWTVTFSEDVENVTDDDFSLSIGGGGDIVADAPTVSGGPTTYTVTALNVAGTVGTLGLVFKDGTDVASVADGTPAGGTLGPSYSIGVGVSLPVAGPFSLLLGILALLLSGAAFVYGRTKWINT
jgi:hypothetical protein